MLIKANRRNLKKHAKTLLGNEYSPDTEKTLIKEALTGFVRTYGHISHDRGDHLERLDKILKTHGVEGVLDNRVDIQYCNTGDTYAMTLLYWENDLWLGDWGTIIEELGE